MQYVFKRVENKIHKKLQIPSRKTRKHCETRSFNMQIKTSLIQSAKNIVVEWKNRNKAQNSQKLHIIIFIKDLKTRRII